jgi:16S rRNA (guanine527-N7)-methyltransferase
MQILKLFLEKELNIKNDKIIENFINYEKLLFEWNIKINLVSRKTTSIESHILNSIFFLAKYTFPGNSKIIDIGTGGGFPGIPLKIIMSGLNIMLADSIQKKIKAVKDIISKLELNDVRIICGRAEDLSKKKEYSKKFDIVIAKSVSTLDNLYAWSVELAKNRGEMIFIKGGDISGELISLENKFKNIDYKIINYDFDKIYGIEDKKIVLIKNKNRK